MLSWWLRSAGDRGELGTEVARIPEEIRGYGHVKERHLVAARARWNELLARWRGEAAQGAGRAAA